ncbi:hypothetical protein [Gallaecimonas xiamenensis]|uniref:MSHA biogenesis protein MshI n=1 Tax=Gallaecimonas xiamenensis 3-C-1 TaxID=745411 RepID=K2IC04_9GAMM|nr:hypothetical protein [Gallaecimonas xiamenensis]EKE67451.1 hypothetical protein B3C1_18617 [Gallaecimonas xiamenensis 3-C-1]
MKHWLNLLSDDLKPAKERLSAQTLLGSWLLGSLVLALALGWGYWQKASLNQADRQLQQQRQQVAGQLEQAEARLKARQPDPQLLASRDALKARIQSNASLLDRIDQLDHSGQGGFSGILTALAHRSQDGLWLSKVAIRGDLLSLAGSTREASLVPVWVQGFAKEPALAGRSFGQVQIQRSDQGDLHFSLNSGGSHEAP